MRLDSRGIRELHTAFGEPLRIVDRRRALYSAVLELISGARPSVSGSDLDLLDSPVARGHLGELLSGQTWRCDPNRLVPLSVIADAGGARPAVASRAIVPDVLGEALRLVRGGTDADAGSFVTATSPDYIVTKRLIGEGIDLLRSVSPDLAADVLPHVCLIAVVEHTKRFGSASFRELPGMVLVPEPESAFEVAEALVHEAAHQKFFDLSVTCAMLNASAYDGPNYRASWSAGRSSWPLEQCLAAFHAYRCLAAFEQDRARAGIARHATSLLERADERADELGEWLQGNDDHLGGDGRKFLDLLSGREPAVDAAVHVPDVTVDDATVTRTCGDRTLLVFAGTPIRLVWQPAVAG